MLDSLNHIYVSQVTAETPVKYKRVIKQYFDYTKRWENRIT